MIEQLSFVRCKEVEWLPFLTTKLVDNVAAHIRLYSQAKNRGKEQNEKELNSNASAYDIEQIFFELEKAMNHHKLCRKKVCSDSNYEKGLAFQLHC